MIVYRFCFKDKTGFLKGELEKLKIFGMDAAALDELCLYQMLSQDPRSRFDVDSVEVDSH